MTDLGDITRSFGRIGLISFGGPAGQIALMHRVLVDDRRWLTEAEFLRALSLCMLLPGPEAMQLATYAGWRLRGIPGGLIAGGLFVLPGAALILLLAFLYVTLGQLPLMAGLLLGLKAAVVAILFQALIRLAARALPGWPQRGIALAAFVAIFFLSLPFPLILAAAALAGVGLIRKDAAPAPARPAATPGSLAATFATGLALWFAPLLALWATGQGFLLSIGLYFSRLAVVTFGGAYAVLGDMTQTMVVGHGWLTSGQMMDALGLAETTPGPLILVTEFTAFLAGAGEGGLPLALAAALLCLWVSFVPCFLWIFAFGPFVETLTARPRLSSALAGITAAVVGVIANLGLWFTLHFAFTATRRVIRGPFDFPLPDPGSLSPLALAATAFAALLLFRLRLPVVAVIAASAAFGLLARAVATG
ncbi:MAG: chromate efflux transporter [Defluviimonas denitrificans]